jgi:tetratricopeptide (TPR) repeat protein
MAQTHDQHRDDPRAAIDAYNRLFTLDDSQLDVLDLLENLHVLLSDWAGHVEVLERKVARTLDDEDRKRLLHTIGDSQRDMLGNPALAISAFRRALDIDPADVFALEALDGLYSAAGDAAELAGVLSQRLSIEGDPEVRRETALRLGRLWEVELATRSRRSTRTAAASTTRPPTGRPSSPSSASTSSSSLWSDLQENLRTQVALAADDRERAPLLLRLGELQATHLGDPTARSRPGARCSRSTPRASRGHRGGARPRRQPRPAPPRWRSSSPSSATPRAGTTSSPCSS